MASSASYVKKATGVLAPIAAAAMAYGAYRCDTVKVEEVVKAFLTGPGSKSRIFAVAVVLLNWKSLPFSWTFRVWSAMVQHILIRDFHTHPPSALFRPVVVRSHVGLAEVDYNIHKSNSTYFADLDVSRTHLVGHLFGRGIRTLARNHETKLVLDPRSSGSSSGDSPAAAPGKFGIMLGGVHCSFKREILPGQRFEMWSRMLGWDRKWLYMASYFVEKGTVPGRDDGWEKRVFATSMSKYVVKIGRLTVHPAVLIGASGLLPERPGGWMVDGEGGEGKEEETNGSAETKGTSSSTEWDWRRIEAERKKGLELVENFASLDGLQNTFPMTAEEGPLGTWGPG